MVQCTLCKVVQCTLCRMLHKAVHSGVTMYVAYERFSVTLCSCYFDSSKSESFLLLIFSLSVVGG